VTSSPLLRSANKADLALLEALPPDGAAMKSAGIGGGGGPGGGGGAPHTGGLGAFDGVPEAIHVAQLSQP